MIIDLKNGKNGTAPVVRLNSGHMLPVVGLGTYALHGDACVNAVYQAVQSGYRLIDTASFYGNEREVGEGVRQSGVSRSEIFVQTKLYPNQYSHAEQAIDEALSKLDIGYIDMMLLHHPASDDVTAYQAIEQAIREGKVRTAGISCSTIKTSATGLSLRLCSSPGKSPRAPLCSKRRTPNGAVWRCSCRCSRCPALSRWSRAQPRRRPVA